MPKIRTPEQKSRKMLKEETTIIDLEMAIKKEKFRKIQKRTPGLVYDVLTVNKSLEMEMELTKQLQMDGQLK